MTTRQTPDVLTAREEIVAPPAQRACEDQSFELPSGIFVAMGVMFTGFVAVLSFAFSGHMGVSFAAIFAFIAALNAIPAIFPRMARNGHRGALDWDEFLGRGIETATGRAKAGSATVLVLMLPFLILCFGIAIAMIAAFV
jgi:hypothetical protein